MNLPLTIVLGFLFGLLCLFLLVFSGAGIAYLRYFDKRYDGNKFLKYFTEKDFPGLHAEPVSFRSDRGQLLRGFLYSAVEQPQGLIIFVHGFGAGHYAYTAEIAYLANCGFLVLAYDGTGCVLSEGTFRGFDQGPVDLIAALRFVAADDRLRHFERVVLIGHSWGAFSVMNSMESDRRVAGCVAMCGFISGADAMGQTGSPHFYPLAIFLGACFRLFNRMRFRSDANKNSIRSLSETQKRALLLYGKKDKIVLYKYNGARIADAVKDRQNIQCICYERKGHNVYLSERAEHYMNGEFALRNALAKRRKKNAAELLSSVDYQLLTEEDDAVMERIKNFCLSVFKGEKSV